MGGLDDNDKAYVSIARVFNYERFRIKNEHFRRLMLPNHLIYRCGGFGTAMVRRKASVNTKPFAYEKSVLSPSFLFVLIRL